MVEHDGAVMIDNPFNDPNTVKIMVCVPSMGLIDCQVYDNHVDFHTYNGVLTTRVFQDLEAGKTKFKFFSRNMGRMGINYARESLSAMAQEYKMDYILMIDDDQTIPRDLFERLYRTMQKTGADIVSPMVTQRVPPYKPVIWKQSYSEENGKKAVYNLFIESYEPNSIVEADAVGFGVVLMKADILSKVARPWFFSNNSFGEDIWFCMRARAAGCKIVMDTSIKVGHMKIPEPAMEIDWIRATKQEEKFKSIYPDLQTSYTCTKEEALT